VPRRLVIGMITSLVIAWTVAIFPLAHRMTAFGVFILVGSTLVIGINLFAIKRTSGQPPGNPRRRGGVTGRVLAPQPGWPWPSGQATSWTGSGNVAAASGLRMNATWPLAVLAVQENALTLRFRPRLIASFGFKGCQWHVGEMSAVFPVRGRLARFNRGLAIESTTMPLAYFWTWRPEPILAVLDAHGVRVERTERHIKLMT